MAGDAISTFTPITLLVAADEFAVVDTIAVETKKITISNLLKQWFQSTNAGGFNLTSLGFIDFGAGSADTGTIRLKNNDSIQWEAAPAGGKWRDYSYSFRNVRVDSWWC